MQGLNISEIFLDGFQLWSILFKILLAVSFGGIIGMERVIRGRAAGMRTHILVCIGSAMTMMVGCYADEILSLNTDPLRIGAQVISGIGFLGVGTILIRGRTEVRGLTTAAGLWTTATIGLAIGIGFYTGAAIATAVTFLTIVVLSKVEAYMTKRKKEFGIYLEIDDVNQVNQIIADLSARYKVKELDVTAPRSAVKDNVGLEIALSCTKDKDTQQMMNDLRHLSHVTFVLESV